MWNGWARPITANHNSHNPMMPPTPEPIIAPSESGSIPDEEDLVLTEIQLWNSLVRDIMAGRYSDEQATTTTSEHDTTTPIESGLIPGEVDTTANPNNRSPTISSALDHKTMRPSEDGMVPSEMGNVALAEPWDSSTATEPGTYGPDTFTIGSGVRDLLLAELQREVPKRKHGHKDERQKNRKRQKRRDSRRALGRTVIPPAAASEGPLQSVDESKEYLLGEFEEEFIDGIGELPYGRIRGKPADCVLLKMIETSDDERWASMGLPESFRSIYDSLPPSPATVPPSVEVLGNWRVDAGYLREKLRELLDRGWNKEADFSDQESFVASD